MISRAQRSLDPAVAADLALNLKNPNQTAKRSHQQGTFQARARGQHRGQIRSQATESVMA